MNWKIMPIIVYIYSIFDNLINGLLYLIFFFFNDPAPPKIYPLPLPDALPISGSGVSIFRPPAPMPASSIPGTSAGGTRASSRILIPSSTPMRVSSVRSVRTPAVRARALPAQPVPQRGRRGRRGYRGERRRSPRCRSVQVAREARGEGANVGDVLEVRE